MSDPRDSLQNEAKEAWLRSNRKNTLVFPTGGGKSKVAIDILKELSERDFKSILLLTNSTELRDTNWKEEFEKWGYRWDSIQSECYQTAYRWEGRHFNFVIADEIDFIAEEYSRFFRNNTCDNILGLTGFITEDKIPLINSIAPICFIAKTEDLQEEGLLNKSEFIFLEYPLNKEKTIEQRKKAGGSFMTSENDLYKYYDKQFQQAMIIKAGLEKEYRLLNINFETKEDWKAADWKYKINAAKRKSILNKAKSSIQVTLNLIEHIHAHQGNKILIFSALTDQCDLLPNPYHGKNDKDNDVLEKLNAGSISTASVVKKVNRGQNLVGVNYLIYESYDGSETEFIQRHGRGLRLRPDQLLKVIVLLPIYHDFIKLEDGTYKNLYIRTQAHKWADKMTSSFNLRRRRYIRLDKTLTIKEGIEI